MENQKNLSFTCCICHRHFSGYGNNPWGAINIFGEEVQWQDGDRCCDTCNSTYVTYGRIYTLTRNKHAK